MDRRLTPANSHVAASHLKGVVEAPQYSDGQARQVVTPVVDLLAAPRGRRDRQLLLGDRVQIYDLRNGFAFVQSAKDGYVGYVEAHQLGPADAPTHSVATSATHLYPEPDLKSHELDGLSFGSHVRVISDRDGYAQTPDGFIPSRHLVPFSAELSDPVTVAGLFCGTPYLWGGNSIWGIDCSGLVQAAYMACGIGCPADSDQQEAQIGHLVEDGFYLPGDLLFWKGHVAMVVTKDVLIHANAHHMAVVYEAIEDAIARIDKQGDGPVTSHRRIG